MREKPGQQRPDGVKPVRERRDDAKVASASSQGPEEVLILFGAHAYQAAVGRDYIGGEEVVQGEAVLAAQPADAAASGETPDPGVCVGATSRGEAVSLGGCVELPPLDARFGGGRPRLRVDADRPHLRKVDRHSAVADSVARDVMAAAAHRNDERVVACEVDRRDYVCRDGGADD